MLRALCYLLIFTYLVFSFCSCSAYSSITSNNAILYPSNNGEPPIKLALGQAFTAQNSLFIKASLDFQSDINSNDVVVSAIGLNEGNILEQQDVNLFRITQNTIQKAGTKLVVPFELPLKKISEFQLRCTWGQDQNNQLNKTIDDQNTLESPEPIKLSLNPELKEINSHQTIERKNLTNSVVLDSIEIIEEDIDEDSETCSNEECRHKKTKISIRAFVKNLSLKPISNLVLAFGLYWASEGKIPDLPKDHDKKRPSEEELSFGKLNIPTGGSIPFKVNIAKPVIELKGGSFRPHIRILSYN